MRTRKRKPKIGDLQVWNIVNAPGAAVYYPVIDTDHAAALIKALADSQLLDPNIHDNTFGLEVFSEGGWEEWMDEDGFEILDKMRDP